MHGCRGPVYSVKLFSRVPCDQIKTLALDEGSRSSVALTKILLHQKYGIQPAEVKLPIGASLEDSDADAVLLIGDRAMYPQTESFHTVWDLGEEWVQWSKLPFVFAIWVAREGVSLDGIDEALMQSRDLGVEKIKEIAASEAGVMNLSEAEVITYLKDHLYFYLGEQETKGLQLYYELASDLGLAAKGVEFGYYNCESSLNCSYYHMPFWARMIEVSNNSSNLTTEIQIIN